MKIEYNVHNAVNRRDCCRVLSKRVDACVIFVDRADSVFSNDAGELSSPFQGQRETIFAVTMPVSHGKEPVEKKIQELDVSGKTRVSMFLEL